MNLTEELDQKQDASINKVLSLSFEYLIAIIAAEYNNTESFKTLDEFNKGNGFSFPKALLYPFFVSLSNGHSESLYKLFGDFHSLNFGPVSLTIYSIIKKDANHPLKYFDFNKDENGYGMYVNPENGIGINNNTQLKDVIDIIKKDIKNTEIQIKQNKYRYSDLTINNDLGVEKPLSEAIESGVKAILRQSSNFFTSGIDILKLHASYYLPYKKRFISQEVSAIPFEELREVKQRPFYLDEVK